MLCWARRPQWTGPKPVESWLSWAAKKVLHFYSNFITFLGLDFVQRHATGCTAFHFRPQFFLSFSKSFGDKTHWHLMETVLVYSVEHFKKAEVKTHRCMSIWSLCNGRPWSHEHGSHNGDQHAALKVTRSPPSHSI